MKNLKNLLAAVTLFGVMMIGTPSVRAGLLVTDFSGNDNTCTQEGDSNGGVIITGYTGVIITGFTGVIITGFTGNDQSCEEGSLNNKGSQNSLTGLIVTD